MVKNGDSSKFHARFLRKGFCTGSNKNKTSLPVKFPKKFGPCNTLLCSNPLGVNRRMAEGRGKAERRHRGTKAKKGRSRDEG